MKLAVDASSQTLIGIGSDGMNDMVLYPSRVQRRVGHKGCFSTCGRSARPYGAEAVEPAFPKGRPHPPKTLRKQAGRNGIVSCWRFSYPESTPWAFMLLKTKHCPTSQAGCRRFESGLPLHGFNNLQRIEIPSIHSFKRQSTDFSAVAGGPVSFGVWTSAGR